MPCQLLFSPVIFSYKKAIRICSHTPFSPSPELRSQSLRIGVLRCFASAIFFGGSPLSSLWLSSWARRRAPLSVSGGGYLTCTVQSNRPLRSLTILPSMVAGAGTIQWRSFLFIRCEKIIVHSGRVRAWSSFPSKVKCPVTSSQLLGVVLSVLSRFLACTWGRAPHEPGIRRPQAERVVQNESPARTHRC